MLTKKLILTWLLTVGFVASACAQVGMETYDATRAIKDISADGFRWKKGAFGALLRVPHIRPTYSSDDAGAIIFNTSTLKFEGWDGTQYIPLGGAVDNIYTADGIIDAGDEDAVRYVAVKPGNALQIFAKYDDTDPGIAPGSFFIMEQGGTSLYYYKRDVGVFEETNGFQTDNDGLIIYSNYTDLATSESYNIEFSFSEGNAVFKDLKAVPVGIQYYGDYSATFTDRSLVDKAYVDAYASGLTWDNIMSNGSNLNSTYTSALGDNTLFFISNHTTPDIGATIGVTGNLNVSEGQIKATGFGFAGVHARNYDDVNDDVSVALIVNHENGESIPTGGIGTAIEYRIQNNTDGGDGVTAGRLIYKFADVTTGAEGSTFELWGKNVGTEYMWMGFTGLGQLKLPRYSAGSFTGTVYKSLAINSSGDVIVTDPTGVSDLESVLTAGSDLTDDHYITQVDGKILSIASNGPSFKYGEINLNSGDISIYTLNSGTSANLGTNNNSAYIQYTGATATTKFFALSTSALQQYEGSSFKAYSVVSSSGSSMGVIDNAATYYNLLRVGTTSTGNQVSFINETETAWTLPRDKPSNSDQIWVADADGNMSWQDLPSGGGDLATVLGSSASGSVSSSSFATVISDETGTGHIVLATSPTLVTPDLGTPSAITLTNATGLPVSTGLSGTGTGVRTFLATPTSANFSAAITDETGSGVVVMNTTPTFNTSLFVPLIIGGTGTTSTLTFQTTTGVGTTGADFVWKGGTNGSNTLMTLTNAGGLTTSGTVSFGTIVCTGSLIRVPGAGFIDWGSSSTRLYAPSNGTLQITSNSGTAGTGILYTGGVRYSYVEKTSAYTVTTYDYYINVTSGTFNVTLPTAVGATGQEYVVKNTGAGTTTVATTSSQLIDGASTVTISAGTGKRLASTGAGWIVVGNF